MKYIIAGNSDTFCSYMKKNNYSIGKDAVYACSWEKFVKITNKDSIVLLRGWWGRNWVKDGLMYITQAYPTIRFEYIDGPFGKEQREKLKSETTHSRFDLMDF